MPKLDQLETVLSLLIQPLFATPNDLPFPTPPPQKSHTNLLKASEKSNFSMARHKADNLSPIFEAGISICLYLMKGAVQILPSCSWTVGPIWHHQMGCIAWSPVPEASFVSSRWLFSHLLTVINFPEVKPTGGNYSSALPSKYLGIHENTFNFVSFSQLPRSLIAHAQVEIRQVQTKSATLEGIHHTVCVVMETNARQNEILKLWSPTVCALFYWCI